MNCNNCGKQLSENSQFCPNCGTKNEMNNFQRDDGISNQSVAYNGLNSQVNNFTNEPYDSDTNTLYNNFNQTPVKVKQRSYWLLGAIPIVTWLLQYFLSDIVEETIEYESTWGNTGDVNGLQFIENCLDLVSATCILAFFPCIIIMIVLYVKNK